MKNSEKIAALVILKNAAELAYTNIGEHSMLGQELDWLHELIGNELNE